MMKIVRIKKYSTHLLANDFGHADHCGFRSRVREHTRVALFAGNRSNVHNATIVARVLSNALLSNGTTEKIGFLTM